MKKKQLCLPLAVMLVLGTLMGRTLGDFVVSSMDTYAAGVLLTTLCPGLLPQLLKKRPIC